MSIYTSHTPPSTILPEEEILQLKNDNVTELHISLIDKGLNDRSIDWTELGKLISTNNNLKELHINGWLGARWKSRERSRQLFKNIATSTSIEHLALNNLGSKAVMFIPSCTKSLANLRNLEFFWTHMGSNGYDALGKLLTHPDCKLEGLTFVGGDFGWAERDKISKVLKNNTSLKTLKLRLNDNTNKKDWKRFLSVSLHDNTSLTELDFSYNISINDEVMADIMTILTGNTTLKTLRLAHLQNVTKVGWRKIPNLYIKVSTCTLENLYLGGNKLGSRTFREFVSACYYNRTLKKLCLKLPSNRSFNTPRVGWNPSMNLLAIRLGLNKRSIIGTFDSNHVLETICYPQVEARFVSAMATCTTKAKDLPSALQMNREPDKFAVARRKILKSHYYDQDDIKENRKYRGYKTVVETILETTNDMEKTEQLPYFMAWIGRDKDGLQLMYELIQRMPTLCENFGKVHADTSAKRQLRSSKRKRND